MCVCACEECRRQTDAADSQPARADRLTDPRRPSSLVPQATKDLARCQMSNHSQQPRFVSCWIMC